MFNFMFGESVLITQEGKRCKTRQITRQGDSITSFFKILVGLLRRYKQNINALSWNFDNNFAINFMWMVWVFFFVCSQDCSTFQKTKFCSTNFHFYHQSVTNFAIKFIKKEENQPKNSDNVDVRNEKFCVFFLQQKP